MLTSCRISAWKKQNTQKVVSIKGKVLGFVGAKGSFRRNSLIMSSGAMINIFIAFFLTPIVTRIYSKEEFGTFYIYMSIVAISSLLVSGMYPHALVVPKYRRDFLALLKLCFMTTLVGVIMVTVVLYMAGPYLLPLVGGDRLVYIWYVIPIGLLFTCVNVIFVNWNVRRKEFKKNASSNVAMSASSKGYQIAYGTLYAGGFSGLVYSDLVSKLIGTIILGAKNMSKDTYLLMRIGKAEVEKIGKEYIKYPTYLLGSNFINRFTSDIPLYLLSAHFGVGAVGAFGFANQMLNIPFNVIGNSIAPVYFQKANELYFDDIERLREFTIRSYDRMLVLGSLAFGFVFSFGDLVFSLVFSSEWKLAGDIAMILSIYFVFKLISSPFARIFRVVRREEVTLQVHIVLAISRTLGIFSGLYFSDILLAMGVFSMGSTIGYAYNNLRVFQVLDIKAWHIFRSALTILIPIFGSFYLLRYMVEYFI